MVDVYRKKIRLPSTRYVGKQIFFVTICCEKRYPAFSNHAVGQWLVGVLAEQSKKHSFALHAYCAMPNHLHILAQGTSASSNLVRFVSRLKQLTAYSYQKKFARPLWQPRYYDHILRKPEETAQVAWYIWLNPVRKGLCPAPRDYPLSGSLTVDWKHRCAPANIWSPPWKDAGEMPG